MPPQLQQGCVGLTERRAPAIDPLSSHDQPVARLGELLAQARTGGEWGSWDYSILTLAPGG